MGSPGLEISTWLRFGKGREIQDLGWRESLEVWKSSESDSSTVGPGDPNIPGPLGGPELLEMISPCDGLY